MNFENLFNGDKTLGKNVFSIKTIILKRLYYKNKILNLGSQMNMFLNENWRDVFKDLKGAISESFGAICKTVLQNYFSRIPLKELILE